MNGEVGNGRSSNRALHLKAHDDTRAGLASLIKRDAPELGARLDEYPSMAAAARAAGISVRVKVLP